MRMFLHQPLLSRSAAAFLGLFLLCATPPLASAKPKLSGLRFPAGQPASQPAAKVEIEEVVQGAQKRGFLRVALLPLAAANGVQIHFFRPDPSVFQEITDTLRSLTQLDAQEFHWLQVFAPGDPVPRFVAEEASSHSDGWTFKKARFHCGVSSVSVLECTLSVTGPSAGQFQPKNAQSAHSSGPPPALPTLVELLSVAP
jgi:hypothetical protein